MRKLSDEKLSAIRKQLLKVIDENEFTRILGIEFLELNVNYAKGRIKNKDDLMNPYGMFHGGCLYSLADIVAGTAACMSGYFVTTVNGSMNFLQAAKDTEYVYCEALKLKTGRHISVYDIRITDDNGNLLDAGEFSFFSSKINVIEE